jgi:LuxR family maltose regulon positive regulatory protein
MYTGQIDAASVRLRAAEAALGSDALVARTADDSGAPAVDISDELPALLGYVAAVQATIPLFVGDLLHAQPLVQKGLDLVPESELVWRAGVLSLAAYCCQLSGEATAAAERQADMALKIARSTDRGTGEVTFLVLSGITNLAHVFLMQGRLRQAAAILKQAPWVPPPLRLENLPGSHAYHAAAGELLRERNDLDAAEQHLKQSVEGLDARIVIQADILAQGYLALARVQQARGEYTTALATLSAFERVARARGFVAELVERGEAMAAQIELVAGNLAVGAQWVESGGLALDDAAQPRFRRETAHLARVRVRIAQSQGDPSGSHLAEALRVLEQLEREAQAQGRGRSVLEILILRALAQHTHRANRGAVGTLAHALALAQPEGYVRLFADEGAPMAALLADLVAAAEQQRLAVSPSVLDYAQALIAVCRSPEGGTLRSMSNPSQDSMTEPTYPVSGVLPLLDPLTEREVEVLRLLAEGASNATIAAKLVVTVGTVKKHVFNVCSKLGAQNRTQAVARARALRLL